VLIHRIAPWSRAGKGVGTFLIDTVEVEASPHVAHADRHVRYLNAPCNLRIVARLTCVSGDRQRQNNGILSALAFSQGLFLGGDSDETGRRRTTTPSDATGGAVLATSRAMEYFPKDQWARYDYNGCLSRGQLTRMGRFENAAGLSIAFYSWEVPNPKGVVIFSHGHGVHATFELLNSPKAPGIRTEYPGTWAESLNKAGYSLFALDHQGHGRSDYARGKRCYFERLQDLVNDFKRFVRLVRQEVGQELPTFLLGMSMGGFVVVNAAIEDENLADGVVLLAPMLSLDRLASRGINKVLLPLVTMISVFLPTLPVAETAKNIKFPHSQLEVEMDDLTYPSGVTRTRCRVAAEYYIGTKRTQTLMHKMKIPFITFHGKDDQMTDPASSEMLYDRASSSDKTLQWVENVFHDLMHEKPTSNDIIAAIVNWLSDRTVGSKPKRKSRAPR
tara:strand:- start:1283 stop:2617 length:1335 start_codon:yes stop_codon:yes gene_type:complete